MSIEVKQKIKEVADDFAMPAKKLIEIVGKFYEKPKSSSQNLTEDQLNVIFDYITQQNQIDSIEQVFAAAAAKKEAPAPVPAPAPAAPAAPAAQNKPAAPAQSNQPRPQQQNQQPRPQQNNVQRPAQPQNNQNNQNAQRPQQPNAQQQPKQPQPERKRERRVIDTSAVTVNADRYDDRVDSLVSDRVQNYQSGKQKIGNKNKKQQQAKRFGTKSRSEEQEKMRRLQLEIAKKAQLVVKIPDEITVGELASRMKKTAAEVIKCLLKNGVMATVNQTIDFDTAEFVATELGCKVEHEVIVTIEERLLDDHQDTADELVTRPPVVVVMGHVDHGKTSLLDAIRHTGVAAGEAGGITQAIGASQVMINDRKITFIDTPGHATFTAMRARGAKVTDIVILIVAADDGVMPQTVESINHAKAAGVPIVVAVNKIDKPGANPDRVRQELTEYGIIPEEWGGQNMFVNISAKQKIGIDDLLETVLLQADVLELKANPDTFASGNVLEAKLDKGRGSVATVLVTRGTLHVGDTLVAGLTYGRVRAMLDPKGHAVTEAGPSDAVEILGLQSVPNAGDEFRVFEDEREARALADERSLKARIEEQSRVKHVTLENLFETIADAEVKELNLIIKADVQGSIEALQDSLDKMDQSEVRINTIHSAVGAINETDVVLADASNAIIIGFGVRPDGKARSAAEREGVEIRCYDVIYKCLEDLDAARIGMLKPTEVEVSTGTATVLDTFKVPKVGIAAGVRVEEGEIAATDSVRLVRDGIVVFNGKIASMRHYKDEAKSLKSGSEGGIGLENFQDIKPGDTIEGYRIDQVARTE